MEYCHCTVGVGAPVKPTVKLAKSPSHTVSLRGFEVIVVGELIVNVAAVVVALLQEFVKTARYCCITCTGKGDVETFNVVLVALGISLHVDPNSSCHCTLGAGLPDAAAVRATDEPPQTVELDGLVVTAGTVLTVSVAGVEMTDVPHAFDTTA